MLAHGPVQNCPQGSQSDLHNSAEVTQAHDILGIQVLLQPNCMQKANCVSDTLHHSCLVPSSLQLLVSTKDMLKHVLDVNPGDDSALLAEDPV